MALPGAVLAQRPWDGPSLWAARALFCPMQLLVAAPLLLFLLTLTAMLLRHPDVQFYEIDRVMFGVLVVAVVLSSMIRRQRLLVFDRITWPMLGLTLMAFLGAVSQPFDHEIWSLLASKFVVPFTMFYLAGHVFTEEKDFRKFEIFILLVLAYLSFTAIAFLCGAHSLIFPRFILDESLGFHADRARGPLLQAVANGVSLNILGLLAVHAYRRGSVRGTKIVLLLATVPVAILATMTRAVWLSFAGSIVALIVLSRNKALRRVCAAAAIVVAGGAAILLSTDHVFESLSERLEERGPIDYRAAVYAGGWEMFLQRPWVGWGFHQMPAELPKHVSGYNEKVLYPHNTYLELAVEHGLVGIALYAWLMWELWRLRRGGIPAREKAGFLDHRFHVLWAVILAVYWMNAAVVVMSYQFVNGLLFSVAGMLAAQRRRAREVPAC
jgi:putative inorganic carbon (HCO3(-)) transporter